MKNSLAPIAFGIVWMTGSLFYAVSFALEVWGKFDGFDCLWRLVLGVPLNFTFWPCMLIWDILKFIFSSVF
jgi:hypothetical protein